MPIIPALWEAEVGESPEVRNLRLVQSMWAISTKTTKIGWVQWLTPITLALWEAKVGRS